VFKTRIAALTAALLLLAQLIAAGHVHPWALRNAISNGTELAAGDALCPICVFHAHVPFSAASAPLLAQPLAGHSVVAVASISRPVAVPKPQLFGRAPPASI
jgi:hypothetical protein